MPNRSACTPNCDDTGVSTISGISKIAIVGVTLQVISPLAVLIAIAVAIVQYRRMINEEKILNSAFPEYRLYAARTPLLIPAGLSGLYGRSNPV